MFQKLAAGIRRRKRLSAVFVLCIIVVIGPYPISRFRSAGRRIRVRSIADSNGPRQTTAQERSSIRIVSFNIAHGRGDTDDNWKESGHRKHARIEKIASLIEETEADIVVLNEVDFDSTWSGHQNQAEAIAKLAEYPFWVEQRNLDFRFAYGTWKFGNAILSKFPIVDCRPVEFPAYKPWERLLAGCKRGAICTLQVSPNRRIRVVAVHLEHRNEDVRVKSARMIEELAGTSEWPLIAVGDFNSTPTGFPRAEQSTTGKTAFDVLVASNQFQFQPRLKPSADEMTFLSSDPTQVIDWILIPPNWEFADYKVIKSTLSDHRPVSATIVFDE